MRKSMAAICQLVFLFLLAVSCNLPAAEPVMRLVYLGAVNIEGRLALGIAPDQPFSREHDWDKLLRVEPLSGSATGRWRIAGDGALLIYEPVMSGHHYQVTVTDTNLFDVSGLAASESLKPDSGNNTRTDATAEFTVEIKPLAPVARFKGRGPVVAVEAGDTLPVETVNAPEFDIEFLKVNDLHRFAELFYWNRDRSTWDLSRLSGSCTSLDSRRYHVSALPNQKFISRVSLDWLPGRGLYIAVLKRAGGYDYRDFNIRTVLRTDLGLHVRLYPERCMIVAAALSSGNVPENAELTVLGKEGERFKGAVNKDGIVELDFRPAPDDVLLLRTADDMSLMTLRDVALDLSGFDIKGEVSKPLSVFGWTNRTLIQPGEAVPWCVLLRDMDGRQVTTQPLTFKLVSADGRIVSERRLQPEINGFYRTEFTVPADAPLGRWRVLVYSDPSAAPLQTLAFDVQEFLPERMALETGKPDGALLLEKPFAVSLKGRYLFGSPASGNQVTANAAWYWMPESQPDWKGYIFGHQPQLPRLFQNLEPVKLDAEGQGSLTVTPPLPERPTPLNVRLNLGLEEWGGRPVTREVEARLWPEQAVPGIYPEFSNYQIEENSEAGFNVIVVNANGSVVTGQSLNAVLIQRQRDVFWVYEAGRGWQLKEEHHDIPQAVRTLTSGSEPVRVYFPVTQGQYILRIQYAGDKDSSSPLTEYSFRAGWGDDIPPPKPGQLTLRTDKPRYHVGDKVTLQVYSPQVGEMLVALESDRMLWQQRSHVDAGETSVTFNLHKDWQRHDLYASALLFSKKESGLPQRLLGIKPILLDRDKRQLSVALKTGKALPETKLDIQVQAEGIKPEDNAAVVISLVDQGILALGKYPTPDPASFFFGRKRYSSDLLDLYWRIFDQPKAPFAEYHCGADGGLMMKRSSRAPRALVERKTVALMSQPVKLDQQGQAKVMLDLPDFNGEGKLSAVVFTDNTYGKAEQQIPIHAPVVAEPSLPRFVAPGDRSRIVLEFHNLSGIDLALKPTVSVKPPLTLAPGKQALPAALPIKNAEQKIFDYWLGAENKSENAKSGVLELGASAESLSLQRHWKIPVRPVIPAERRVRRLVIPVDEQFTLRKQELAGLVTGSVKGHLLLASGPVVDLSAIADGLFAYPYGCLEQTVSQAFPLLYADQPEVQSLQLPQLGEEQGQARLENAVQRIIGMQNRRGGFGCWNSFAAEDPWLTVYAVDFLLRAQSHLSIPKDVLDKGLKRLELWLDQGLPPDNNQQLYVIRDFSVRCYAASVLSRQLKAPLPRLDSLLNLRPSSITGLSLVQLGAAFIRQGDATRGERLLREGLTKSRPTQPYWLGDYGSQLRDDAWGLILCDELEDEALLAHRLPEQEQSALELDKMLSHTAWPSTQERQILFRAGLILARQATRSWQAQWGDQSLERQGIATFSLTGQTFGADKEGTPAAYTIRNTGDQPLYLFWELDGYPQDNKIKTTLPYQTAKRQYYSVEGKLIADGKVAVGDIIIAVVTCSVNEPVYEALLVDLLPAGLEPEKSDNLRTLLNQIQVDGRPLSEQLTSPKYQEQRSDRYVASASMEKGQVYRFAYLLRAVSEGEYAVPPVWVEDMFTPERHFASGGGRLKVVSSRAEK